MSAGITASLTSKPKYNNNMVQATKEYKDDKVIAHVVINDRQPFALAFEDEREMQRLGECLIDLARGCKSSKIG